MLARLPALDADDTLVFLGDYLDRGPDSAGVVRRLMTLPGQTPARVVCLRGNHEDGWLRALGGQWPQFVLPVGNGCLQTYESFLGRPVSPPGTGASVEDLRHMLAGDFFTAEVLAWMEGLAWWHEDAYALYVHAGLPEDDEGRFLHPAATQGQQRTALLWLRSRRFFEEYRGKAVIFGHTSTKQLPPELSRYTPDDPTDLWAGPAVFGLDTGCGKGGFLTALEVPAMRVHESR
ncbi:MAG: metallophosphoesterase [bacterium]